MKEIKDCIDQLYSLKLNNNSGTKEWLKYIDRFTQLKDKPRGEKEQGRYVKGFSSSYDACMFSYVFAYAMSFNREILADVYNKSKYSDKEYLPFIIAAYQYSQRQLAENLYARLERYVLDNCTDLREFGPLGYQRGVADSQLEKWREKLNLPSWSPADCPVEISDASLVEMRDMHLYGLKYLARQIISERNVILRQKALRNFCIFVICYVFDCSNCNKDEYINSECKNVIAALAELILTSVVDYICDNKMRDNLNCYGDSLTERQQCFSEIICEQYRFHLEKLKDLRIGGGYEELDGDPYKVATVCFGGPLLPILHSCKDAGDGSSTTETLRKLFSAGGETSNLFKPFLSKTAIAYTLDSCSLLKIQQRDPKRSALVEQKDDALYGACQMATVHFFDAMASVIVLGDLNNQVPTLRKRLLLQEYLVYFRDSCDLARLPRGASEELFNQLLELLMVYYPSRDNVRLSAPIRLSELREKLRLTNETKEERLALVLLASFASRDSFDGSEELDALRGAVFEAYHKELDGQSKKSSGLDESIRNLEEFLNAQERN